MIYLIGADILGDLQEVRDFASFSEFSEAYVSGDENVVVVVASEGAIEADKKAYKKAIKNKNIMMVYLNKSKSLDELIEHQLGKLGACLYLNEPFDEESLRSIKDSFPDFYSSSLPGSEKEEIDNSVDEKETIVEEDQTNVDEEKGIVDEDKTLEDIDISKLEDASSSEIAPSEKENEEEHFSVLEGTIKTAIGIGEETPDSKLENFDEMFEVSQGEMMDSSDKKDEEKNDSVGGDESLVFDLDVDEKTGETVAGGGEDDSIDLSAPVPEETETIQGSVDIEMNDVMEGASDGGSDSLELGSDIAPGDSGTANTNDLELDNEMDELFSSELKGEDSSSLSLPELELGTNELDFSGDGIDLGEQGTSKVTDSNSESIELPEEDLAVDDDLDLDSGDLDIAPGGDDLTQSDANIKVTASSDNSPGADIDLSDATYPEFDYKSESIAIDQAPQEAENDLTDTEQEVSTPQESFSETPEVAAESFEIGSDPLPTAVIKEDELVRLQATLQSIKSERDELRLKIELLEDDKRELKRKSEHLQEDLDEARIELSIIKQRGSKNSTDNQERLIKSEEKQSLLEGKLKAMQQELSKAKHENRIDQSKVQVREKELESKIELMELDFSAQTKSREEKILELKRCVETLEFSVESMGIQNQSFKEDRRVIEERLRLVVTSLRGSIDVLEEDTEVFSDIPQKNEEM